MSRHKKEVVFQLVTLEPPPSDGWKNFVLDQPLSYAPHQIALLAREVPISALRSDPQPGDLVVEPSMIRRDNDAIGWLVAHGDAPYNEDGTGELREIWDVIPLARGRDGKPLRWENAEFYALPDSLAALVR